MSSSFIVKPVGNPSKNPVLTESSLMPVIRADWLLSQKRYRPLLGQIRELSGLADEDEFQATFTETIKAFVEWVQVLPSSVNGAMCGLLNQGLVRSLSVLQQHLLNYGSNVSAVERYAVFTVALFIDISKIVTLHRINITNKSGEIREAWSPLLEASLVECQADYYQILSYGSPYSRLTVSLTSLLARQIMPSIAFEWLSMDLNLLADWLAALRDDGTDAGRLGRSLALFRMDEKWDLLQQLGALPLELGEDVTNKNGRAFLDWLRKALADGSLTLNQTDSKVHMTERGLLVDKTLIESFVGLSNLTANKISVPRQIGNLMGITKKSGSDFKFEQYFGSADGASSFSAFAKAGVSKFNGVVLDSALVGANVKNEHRIQVHSSGKPASGINMSRYISLNTQPIAGSSRRS